MKKNFTTITLLALTTLCAISPIAAMHDTQPYDQWQPNTEYLKEAANAMKPGAGQNDAQRIIDGRQNQSQTIMHYTAQTVVQTTQSPDPSDTPAIPAVTRKETGEEYKKRIDGLQSSALKGWLAGPLKPDAQTDDERIKACLHIMTGEPIVSDPEKRMFTHDVDNGNILLLDPTTGKRKQTLKINPENIDPDYWDPTTAEASLCNGNLAIATTDPEIMIWDTDTGKCKKIISNLPMYVTVNSLRELPNGTIAAGLSNGSIAITCPNVGRTLHLLTSHVAPHNHGYHAIEILANGNLASQYSYEHINIKPYQTKLKSHPIKIWRRDTLLTMLNPHKAQEAAQAPQKTLHSVMRKMFGPRNAFAIKNIQMKKQLAEVEPQLLLTHKK